jgi:hypothetical protein
MNKSTRLIITAAAMAGLYAGALTARASADHHAGKPAAETGKDKAGCSGKDGCKGKDTCKSADGKDTCKAKESCKGKDTCKSADGKDTCKAKAGCSGKDGCGGKKEKPKT